MGTENSSKQWNKLLPVWMPLSMILMLSCNVTRELLDRVLSGVIWAEAQFAQKAIAIPITTETAVVESRLVCMVDCGDRYFKLYHRFGVSEARRRHRFNPFA